MSLSISRDDRDQYLDNDRDSDEETLYDCEVELPAHELVHNADHTAFYRVKDTIVLVCSYILGEHKAVRKWVARSDGTVRYTNYDVELDCILDSMDHDHHPKIQALVESSADDELGEAVYFQFCEILLELIDRRDQCCLMFNADDSPCSSDTDSLFSDKESSTSPSSVGSI